MIFMAELKYVGPESITDTKLKDNVVSAINVDNLASSFSSSESQFSDASVYITKNTVPSYRAEQDLKGKLTYNELNSEVEKYWHSQDVGTRLAVMPADGVFTNRDFNYQPPKNASYALVSMINEKWPDFRPASEILGFKDIEFSIVAPRPSADNGYFINRFKLLVWSFMTFDSRLSYHLTTYIEAKHGDREFKTVALSETSSSSGYKVVRFPQIDHDYIVNAGEKVTIRRNVVGARFNANATGGRLLAILVPEGDTV